MTAWVGALGAFVGMWLVMMVPMMLPSLVVELRHYERAAGVRHALVAAIAYFAVWACAGALVFPIGTEATALARHFTPETLRRATGAVIVAAGALQFSTWKLGHLTCCRHPGTPFAHIHPWMYGVRLGAHCAYCCLGFTAVLLVVGMMEVRTMVVVAAAITVERLAARPERMARILGCALVLVGGMMVVRG